MTAYLSALRHHSAVLQFDGILEGAGQDSVYATCAHEVAESLVAGYNGTIFCYGQVCLQFISHLCSPSLNVTGYRPSAFELFDHQGLC